MVVVATMLEAFGTGKLMNNLVGLNKKVSAGEVCACVRRRGVRMYARALESVEETCISRLAPAPLMTTTRRGFFLRQMWPWQLPSPPHAIKREKREIKISAGTEPRRRLAANHHHHHYHNHHHHHRGPYHPPTMIKWAALRGRKKMGGNNHVLGEN